MSDILMDATTGFISAEELTEIAEEPSELAAGAAASTPWCAIGATAGISAALQGGCPTSGCTWRC
ncbi:hypothetical protein ACFQ6V_24270 [Streptomyces roseifaciens]